MKKISMLLCAAMFVISCNEKKESGESNKSERFLDNMKGDVWKVSETTYTADSTGKIGNMDTCCVNVSEYDSAGYFTHYTSKNNKGEETFNEVVSRYDNKLFKEITMTTKGKPSGHITIQLDKDGKKYATAQEYDSTGKLSSFYKDMEQNEFDQLTMMKQFKPDSTLKSVQETKYDKYIFISQSNKDSSGREIFKSVSKVDDKGNQIELTTTTIEKSPATKKDTTITKVKKFKYDSYDDQGNWTQRTEMDDKGKVAMVVKREITYYKKP